MKIIPTMVRNLRLKLSRSLFGQGAQGGERGQSLIMMALLMIPLLGMLALAVDGGMAFVQRARAQNAADAGAMAGARRLAIQGTDAQVLSAINEYAVTRNGASWFTATYYPSGATVGAGTVPSDAIGVRVTANIGFSTYFAAILGRPTMTASANGSAAMGGVNSPGPSVQPLGKKCTQTTLAACGYVYGQSYEIWQGGGPGNFGWLSWNGGNSANYVQAMLTPGHVADYDDPHNVCSAIAVGCWVQGLPGVNNSSGNRAALNNWITLGQAGTPMIVIIYDTSEGSGSNVNYHVVGFASFILESYSLPGKTITGRFIQWVTGAPVSSGGSNFGMSSVHMIP